MSTSCQLPVNLCQPSQFLRRRQIKTIEEAKARERQAQANPTGHTLEENFPQGVSAKHQNEAKQEASTSEAVVIGEASKPQNEVLPTHVSTSEKLAKERQIKANPTGLKPTLVEKFPQGVTKPTLVGNFTQGVTKSRDLAAAKVGGKKFLDDRTVNEFLY